MGLSDKLYSGAATFGKIEAWVGGVVATIMCIILIIVGIVLLVHKNKYTSSVLATITNDPNCMEDIGDSGTKWYCPDIKISYTVNSVNYTNGISTDSSIHYVNGGKITIYYNKNNPSDISLTKDSYNWVGWILIGVGLLLLVGAWVWVVISMKSKFAAAVGGVAGAAGMISDAIRG